MKHILSQVGVYLNSGHFFWNAWLAFIVVNAHPKLLQIFGSIVHGGLQKVDMVFTLKSPSTEIKCYTSNQ